MAEGSTLFPRNCSASQIFSVAAVAASILLLSACRQDMHNQPRYKPLAATNFFGDGRSARPTIEDTVARGQLRIDPAHYTGKVGGKDVDHIPIKITKLDIGAWSGTL